MISISIHLSTCGEHDELCSLPLSHLCVVRLMFSLFFILFSFLFLLLSFFFFFFFFIFVTIFLVIQSDLEQIFKKFDGNFHCAHVLIVKDYGKLGILYDEKFGGFLLKKRPAFTKRKVGLCRAK